VTWKLELGNLAETNFDSIQFDSAEFRFDLIDYCCVTWGWGHLFCIVRCTHKIVNSHFFGISCKWTV